MFAKWQRRGPWRFGSWRTLNRICSVLLARIGITKIWEVAGDWGLCRVMKEDNYIEYLSSSMFQMLFLLTRSAFGDLYLQDWSDMLKPQCGWGFNSAISACDKGGQLSLARGLLDTMLQAAVLPDVAWQHVRFNNTIRSPAMSLLSMSCRNSIHFSMRMALFQGLFRKKYAFKCGFQHHPYQGSLPNSGKVVTFNGLLSASAKDREWWATLQLLDGGEDMGLLI